MPQHDTCNRDAECARVGEVPRIGADDFIVSTIVWTGRRGGYAEFICVNVRWVRSSNAAGATGFGATMKGRTGGLESEGSPEGFGLPFLTGALSLQSSRWTLPINEVRDEPRRRCAHYSCAEPLAPGGPLPGRSGDAPNGDCLGTACADRSGAILFRSHFVAVKPPSNHAWLPAEFLPQLARGHSRPVTAGF
jgi:hypothetical protein